MKSTLLRETSGLAPKARAAATTLFKNGSVLTLTAAPGECHLVGDLQWSGDFGIALFIAFGEGPRDVRHFALDRLAVEHDGSVAFYYEDTCCARLQAIEHAPVDDPDDYRIAWHLWQQIAPLRHALIERSYAEAVPLL